MAMVTHFLKEGSTLKELGLDGAEALDVEDLFPWIQDQISQQHTESDEYDTDLEEGELYIMCMPIYHIGRFISSCIMLDVYHHINHTRFRSWFPISWRQHICL